MLDTVVGFFAETLETGIGFAYSMRKLDSSQKQAIIGCCEFLAYSGWVLWFIDNGSFETLHVIPQPNYPQPN